MSGEMQLTPEAKAVEDEWKAEHNSECSCWKCMHIMMPLIEQLDQAQREIERLENEVYDLRKAYEGKPGTGARGPAGGQIGQ